MGQKMEKVLCSNCLNLFMKREAEIKRTKNNYCSKQCKADKIVSQKVLENLSNYTETKSGCWEWGGAKNKNGYGIVRWIKCLGLAHRFFYEHHNECKISSDMCACHKCDNPICVNPEHIFIGTHADNMRDMVSKGRNRPRKPAPPKVGE